MSSFFKCETCATTMTGQASYQQHVQGKKHIKMLKNVGKINMVPSSTTPPTPPGPPPKAKVPGYGGRFVQQVSSTQSSSEKGQLGLPKVDHFSLQSEIAASNAALANNPNEPDIPSMLGYGATTDPVMNAVKANMLGKLPLKKVPYKGGCEVCCVQYSSKDHEDAHVSGKKHTKKMQNLQASEGIERSGTLYCAFCNLQLNSQDQMVQHRAGSAHLKNVNQARRVQTDQASEAKKKFVFSQDRIQVPPPPPISSFQRPM